MRYCFFNSHPHKEDDRKEIQVQSEPLIFNSHPHKEDDLCNIFYLHPCRFSTHILTRRMTIRELLAHKYHRLFNSHPHKEDDCTSPRYIRIKRFSTHILTRRMTAILNKNTLSKTARIIPFEYNTLKIYIFSNSYLLFFWKSTPFSGANLQEDFCALIIRTKISKYP